VANLFDEANAPEGEPHKFTLGDFVQWKRSDLVAHYPVASFSAEFVARSSHAGSTEFKIAATEGDSTYYYFSADSSVTETYTAGHYHWQLEVTQTSSGNRIVVDSGTIDLIEDLDVNGADPRSTAAVMIQKIDSLLLGKADSDVSNYSIQGRSLTKFSFAELMEAREKFKAEYQRELNKELAQNGEKTGQTILVRF